MAQPNAKGSGFERDISAQLSLWHSHGENKHIFNRRSGSGGAGRDKQGLSGSGGDIYADDHVGKWLTDHIMLELKFYKDLTSTFWRYVAGKNSEIDEFIRQSRESADVYNRTWGVIFKCNSRDTLFITNSKVIGESVKEAFYYTRNGEELWLFPFISFLEVSPEGLRDRIAQRT